MFQKIEECFDFIFQLKASEYKGEPLEAVRIILQQLNNPHKKVKYIHFAGSNGKGSTLNATREILMAHGLQVGAFTSPHLERANERITINKIQITDEKFLQYANNVKNIIERELDGKFPTFFEVVMLIAFQHFAAENIDIALIEAGIGGRIDSTNVINPEVSVITTISLEHTDILGDTYEKIAYEKAGIIKEGKPVIVGVKNESALKVIELKASQCHSNLFILGDSFDTSSIKSTLPQTFDFQFEKREIKDIQLSMIGQHQVDNAALAITASLLVDSKIKDSTIRDALLHAKWEGRFENIKDNIIIDGAHNPEGTSVLIKTLRDVFPNKKYNFIYAALKDKDHGKSIAMMDKVASKMSFTEIPLPRAEKAEILSSKSTHRNIQVESDWKRLVQLEKENLNDDELLIITGSLYFIAEVRKYLLSQE